MTNTRPKPTDPAWPMAVSERYLRWHLNQALKEMADPDGEVWTQQALECCVQTTIDVAAKLAEKGYPDMYLYLKAMQDAEKNKESDHGLH